MPLSFLRDDLTALASYFAAHDSVAASEWNITHTVFLPSENACAAVEAALDRFGLFVSYRDRIDDDARSYWIDLMEPVPPDATEVEGRIRRVLDALEKHDGEYNSFLVIGSRGESFPR